MEALQTKRPAEDALQFGPMHPDERLTKPVATGGTKPNWMCGDPLARAAVAVDQFGRFRRDGHERVVNSETPHLADPVRTQADRGADFRQFVSLLENLERKASLAERQR